MRRWCGWRRIGARCGDPRKAGSNTYGAWLLTDTGFSWSTPTPLPAAPPACQPMHRQYLSTSTAVQSRLRRRRSEQAGFRAELATGQPLRLALEQRLQPAVVVEAADAEAEHMALRPVPTQVNANRQRQAAGAQPGQIEHDPARGHAAGRQPPGRAFHAGVVPVRHGKQQSQPRQRNPGPQSVHQPLEHEAAKPKGIAPTETRCVTAAQLPPTLQTMPSAIRRDVAQ
jgi:hypothetical protein